MFILRNMKNYPCNSFLSGTQNKMRFRGLFRENFFKFLNENICCDHHYYVVQTLECTFIQGSDKVVMVIC